mgnify:CR=1 FL=1
MDTRSKRWRAAVSFTAFFLGISLLLTSVPEALSLLTGGSWKRTSVADAFQEDYQNTRAFRDAVASYLEDFLTMAVGGTRTTPNTASPTTAKSPPQLWRRPR